MGRAPRGDEPANVRVTVRFTDAEIAEVDDRRGQRLSRAEYVREKTLPAPQVDDRVRLNPLVAGPRIAVHDGVVDRLPDHMFVGLATRCGRCGERRESHR